MLNASGSMVSLGKPLAVGFIALFALCAGIGGWAATTELAGAVLAPGTVVVASNVKKVQHPTGGVVGAILVRNGDHVKAGDVLLKLDETVTRANLQLITKQIDELTGRDARLSAERDNHSSVSFPAELTSRDSDPAVRQILDGEQRLFEQRIRTRRSQIQQLGERIVGLKEEIGGTSAQVAAKSKEIDLIARELSSLELLEVKKLVPTSKMMALRREAARLEGERALMQASIGQSKGRIAEIELQKLGIESEAKSEILREIRDTQGTLAELAERRTAAEDQLRRVDLKSPVNGIVHQLSTFTIGGVISNAEQIMLIVPEGDRLLIEAKIGPQDIDQVRGHKKAIVRLTAFNQRTTPTVNGNVVDVSADTSTEPITGHVHFIARIEIPDSELERLKGLQLRPGMPAEIHIETDARTALSYLIKPFEEQFARAFKER